MPSQPESDLAEDDAAFRDRPRIAPSDHATAAGPAPYAAPPEAIENVSRNPAAGWPAYEVTFPMGNPGLRPGNPPTHCTSRGFSSSCICTRSR